MTIITLTEARELINEARLKEDLALLEGLSERIRAIAGCGENLIAISEEEYDDIQYSGTKLMSDFKSQFELYHDSSGYWIKIP